jgi:transcriptional regulator with XRE-family HTH domain
MPVAFSVDLEPNNDGSFEGIAGAMDWFSDLIPRGTVYTTYRTAAKRPEIVDSLAADYEIGVHVHPREFGHDDDDLATLSHDRQRELINETRKTVAEAAGVEPSEVTAFRAGRHRASLTTLSVLAELNFTIDASVNVRYREHMPAAVTDRMRPFKHESGLVELPTTYRKPPLFSRIGLRTGIRGNITATAHELRTDRRLCTGLQALLWLFRTTDGIVSMYMHPYDATAYQSGITNAGSQFRKRLKSLFETSDRSFVTASEVCESIQC